MSSARWAAGAALAGALPTLYRSAVKAMLARNIRAVNAGDIGPLLATYADDATLVFPGRSSWGREYRGKSEIEGFLRRFVRLGIKGETGAMAVTGPPWSTTVFLQFNDRATSPEGEPIYENRAVIFARIAWGKIRREELYEDTQRTAEFDRYLEAAESADAPPAVRRS